MGYPLFRGSFDGIKHSKVCVNIRPRKGGTGTGGLSRQDGLIMGCHMLQGSSLNEDGQEIMGGSWYHDGFGKNGGGKLSKKVSVHRFFWKEVTDGHRWEGQGQEIDRKGRMREGAR